ncbi:serpin family protein [bacterium]|nr:MAG: serpin family protein [bacterium]
MMESERRYARDLAIVREAVQGRPTGNELISPLAIRLCLGLIELAAAPDQIWAFEGFGPRIARRIIDLLTTGERACAAIANGLWTIASDPYPAYVQSARESMNAHVGRVESADEAVREVNRLVAATTNGRIDRLVDRLSNQTTYVAATAIRFEAAWKVPFEVSATRIDRFRTSSSDIEAPMMTAQRRSGGYSEVNGYQAVTIPYAQPGLNATLILPPEGTGAAEALKRITDEEFIVLHRSPTAEFDLVLPKIDISATFDLTTVLIRLGLPADLPLPRLGSDLAGISEAVQKAQLRWNEEKTEASAGMMIAGALCSTYDAGRVVFDRPFIVTIDHFDSERLLFVGAVENPLTAV